MTEKWEDLMLCSAEAIAVGSIYLVANNCQS